MKELGQDTMQHGTRKRYDKGCRCDLCRQAVTEYMRNYRAKRSPSEENFKHGSYFGYSCGCRCELCVQHKHEYERRLKEKIDLTSEDFKHGTHRGYSLGCRCADCRTAERGYRNAVKENKDFSAAGFPHGERRGYRSGCRCELCREASAKYQKARNEARDKADAKYPHGTTAGSRGGCMCDACREAKREYERTYKRERYANDVEFADRLKEWGRNATKTEHGRKLACARVGKRNALKRTSVSNPSLIKLIYKNCPAGYHVDHIVPLAHGGTHAPENLQYLPASVNIRKKDRLDFDCSEYAIDWRLIVEPSTAISKESRGKRPEAPNVHEKLVDDDIACSAPKGVAA